MLKFERDGQIWFRPGCIDDLLKIINEHPKAKLIAGNTDVGNDPIFGVSWSEWTISANILIWI